MMERITSARFVKLGTRNALILWLSVQTVAKTIGLMIGNVKKGRNINLDLLDLFLGLDLTQ